MVNSVPADLQGIFWSRDIISLDLQRDKNYIIHQVLTYGNLEQIKWLKHTYPLKDIKGEFVTRPRKQYTRSTYNFIKNYVLGINKDLDESKYVKNLPRNIR